MRRSPMLAAVPAAALAFAVAVVPLTLAQPHTADAGTSPTTTPGLSPLSERRVVTGWIPWWKFANGVAGAVSNADLVAEVSPFWYRATVKAGVRPQIDNANPESLLISGIDDLHAAGVAAIPSITDQGFDAQTMARLLSDRGRRGTLIGQIVDTVARTGADGADIDFEAMNFGGSTADKSSVRRTFPVFLAKLRDRLHARGAILSVAVPARRSASDANWAVFDYDAIGRSVDRARIMTYDYSTASSAPGPIAPIDWVRQVTKYAATEFRKVPLSVGVPAYGRNWPIEKLSGSCPAGQGATSVASPTSQEALTLIDTWGATRQWSKTDQEAHYDYERTYSGGGKTCVMLRRVWFGEGRSAQVRLELAQRLDAQGIAVWTLGPEDPGLWTRARTVAESLTPSRARSTLSAPKSVAIDDPYAVVGRFSVSGTPVVAQPVNVQRRVPGRSWKAVGTVNTDERGRARFDAVATRTFIWRMRLPAGWDWSMSQTTALTVKAS